MTHKTLVLLFLIFPALLPAATARALAGNFEEAQKGLSKAYNDYYDALRKPGVNPYKDGPKLAGQILTPARAKVTDASQKEFKQTLDKYNVSSKADLKKLGSKNFGGKNGQPASALRTKAFVSAPDAPKREEVQLDGSGIAREIEFPGPKPAAAKIESKK